MKRFTWQSYIPRLTLTLGICVVALLLMPDMAHAQDTSLAEDISRYMTAWIKVLSWIWIVPASLAGKLMTNSFTYGSVFHLDTYLRKIWTIMRTFAFFTLGFIFIALLWKHIIKNEAPSKLGSLLLNVLKAWLLIPATWFIIAAVIDIATVATAAVAAFPQQILAEQWNSLNTTISLPERTNIEGFSSDQLENTDKYNEVPLKLEDILPHADNVAGPLFFMGAAILKLMDTTKITSDQGWSSTWWTAGKITISVIIRVIALLLFLVPIVVLMIVNMIRVFRIWIWIIFSPFIVLDQVFKWPLQSNDKLGKNFKISAILWLIFQPVAVVWLISLWMILLIWVRDTIVGWGEYGRGTLESKLHTCVEDNGTMFGCNTEIADVFVTWEFFQDLGSRVGGFVGEMILLLFTVFLLWALVKAGFSMSSITSGVADSVYKFSEWMLKSLPVPGTSLSFGSGSIAAGNIWKKLTSDSKVRAQTESLNKHRNRLFGIDTSTDVDNESREKLIKAMESWAGFKEKWKNYWKAMGELSRRQAISYNSSFKQSLSDRFSQWNAIDFLRANKVLTNEELNKTPEEIMRMPNFLTYIDEIMKAWGDVPLTRSQNGAVKTLEGKTRGKR